MSIDAFWFITVYDANEFVSNDAYTISINSYIGKPSSGNSKTCLQSTLGGTVVRVRRIRMAVVCLCARYDTDA